MSRRTTALTLALAALAAVLLWRWVRDDEPDTGTNRIEAQPASPSVSFEHMLDEADEEQVRHLKKTGDLPLGWSPPGGWV